jgi:hypothetical protein
MQEDRTFKIKEKHGALLKQIIPKIGFRRTKHSFLSVD